MTIPRESEMSAPVSAWLTERGYEVYSEVPSYGYLIDLVGIKEAEAVEVVAVEMKLSLTWKVLKQSLLNQLFADHLYCAVASQPRTGSLEKCESQGIGVLRVSDEVAELIAPRLNTHIFEAHRKLVLACLAEMEPGGTGGLPNQKGVGPAQEVERRIATYRATHPQARWKEVYANVPNHYTSTESMCSAMRMVRERRAWAERRKQEAGIYERLKARMHNAELA